MMLDLPDWLDGQFSALLESRKVPMNQRVFYRKWVEFFLDYCRKYQVPDGGLESLVSFLQKLAEKGKKPFQIDQADQAVRMYWQLNALPVPATVPPNQAEAAPTSGGLSGKNLGSGNPKDVVPGNAAPTAIKLMEMGPQWPEALPGNSPAPSVDSHEIPATTGNSASPDSPTSPKSPSNVRTSWVAEYQGLIDEIQTRHYSPKTLKAYKMWVHQFQAFTRSKPPELLDNSDVKSFLTFLAVQRKVSAPTQNQAFNALLFFFRHILHREFGQLEGAVRAKHKRRIPVVLSRKEIDAVLSQLTFPIDLIVKLLYGCGLRLFECLKLRIGCLNLDERLLTVHEGKGKKDRTVPLPELTIPELEAHLERLKNLHQQDLEQGYSGVFLDGALERKYPNAPQEFIWQWVFPAKQLTQIPEKGEVWRSHLHETHVQRSIKEAVGKARLCKRASAHSFRHSFASHLLGKSLLTQVS